MSNEDHDNNSIFVKAPVSDKTMYNKNQNIATSKAKLSENDYGVEVSVIINSSDDEGAPIKNKKIIYVPIESIDSETGKKVYNYWTKKNLETVNHWKNTVAKTSFTYDVVSENYSTKLNTVTLLLFFVNGISTLLGTFSASIVGSNPNNTTLISIGFWVLVIINIINFIGTMLAGSIKIFKWSEIIDDATTFIQKLDNFYAKITSELVLPDKLRENANEFIVKHNDQFIQLMYNSPRVSTADNKIANEQYLQFIKDKSKNFNCAQKYNYDDLFIDIV
jgi:hypothetical protein